MLVLLSKSDGFKGGPPIPVTSRVRWGGQGCLLIRNRDGGGGQDHNIERNKV